MKPIVIGWDARGERVELDGEERESTHMHVIGGSGTGKSKFLEWMVRRDVREGHGLCVIDWHGTLYNDLVRYFAYQDVGAYDDDRAVVILNPSRPDFISGFNPFARTGGDPSVQVNRRVDATIRPWGVTDTNQTPTFARICRVLYTFMVENGETLPNAAALLHFKNEKLRNYAAAHVSDHVILAEWQELQSITRRDHWRDEVLSTKNRLLRFVGSQTVRRFMGLPHGNIDLRAIMDRGQILLVNLGSSDFLDREAARVFASLLLNEFFETAMRRALGRARPAPFMLYLDEFQEYITDDVAAMLDQVRKGGLHMVLAHQHLGHFADNPKLRKSVFTNARIRAVFGGLDYEDACTLGNEMFLPDLNTRQIKKAYYHTIHLYEEQTRSVLSRSSGRSAGRGSTTGTGITFGPVEGWFGNDETLSRFESSTSSETSSEFASEGETVVPIFVPIPVQELASEAEWSREEKLSHVAEMLKFQQQRHCFIKIGTDKTQPLKIPFVRACGDVRDDATEYERQIYERQGAVSGRDVDRLVAEQEKEFFAKAGAPYQPDAAGVEFSDAPPFTFVEEE
jgi:hypothetical protein